MFAPLDWGLGHTTRSIPILRYMRSLGWEVLIACNPLQKKILSDALPDARFLELKGYEVAFGTSRTGTILHILTQIPKFLLRMNAEHEQVQGIVAQEQPDLIVSDNRYGFYCREVPGILITHQLSVRSGLGRWVDRILNIFHRRLINRFSACWIPDVAEEENLAGSLSKSSHENALPRCYYLGGLSRFKTQEKPSLNSGLILILLSGPEPQRSILERSILDQLPFGEYRFVLVRGGATSPDLATDNERVKIYSHLPTDTLEKLLLEAEWVAGRAGYSSIMDYLRLGCRAILIPTPGQAEQEYLADHMQEKKWALSFSQENFNLRQSIEKAKHFTYAKAPSHAFELMETTILQSLNDLERLPVSKSNFEKKSIE